MKKILLLIPVLFLLLNCSNDDPKPVDQRDKFVGRWRGNAEFRIPNELTETDVLDYKIEKSGQSSVSITNMDDNTVDVYSLNSSGSAIVVPEKTTTEKLEDGTSVVYIRNQYFISFENNKLKIDASGKIIIDGEEYAATIKSELNKL